MTAPAEFKQTRPDEAIARITVKNGGTRRKGEKRKTPRTKELMNRYAGSRQLEYRKQSVNRDVANIGLSTQGLYTCKNCNTVKPEENFPHRVATSAKFSRYERCTQCCNGMNEGNLASGVTQYMRNRNATRSIQYQRAIKAMLKVKHGFEEYEAECDEANPPKKVSRIRFTKKEMEETLPLVGHGLVECIFTLPFLTCFVVAGVTSEELMNCAEVTTPMQQLHQEMGGTEQFLQSTVAADLVQIEQHLQFLPSCLFLSASRKHHSQNLKMFSDLMRATS